MEITWVSIINKNSYPKEDCECWVRNGKGEIYHETYHYNFGGFLYSETQAIKDYSNRVTDYLIIEKPVYKNPSPLKMVEKGQLYQSLLTNLLVTALESTNRNRFKGQAEGLGRVGRDNDYFNTEDFIHIPT
jgi:hypothetical protein